MDPRVKTVRSNQSEASKPIPIPRGQAVVKRNEYYVGSPNGAPTTSPLLKRKNFAEFLRQREHLYGNKHPESPMEMDDVNGELSSPTCGT